MNVTQRNIRISLSLVGLTLFIFVVASWLDILPNEDKEKLRARMNYAETLAVQLSIIIESENRKLIPVMIERVAKRNSEVISIELKNPDGTIVENYGVQKKYEKGTESTPDYMKVPIFKDGLVLNVVEVRFVPFAKYYFWGLVESGFLKLVIFISVFSFIIYYLLVRKIVHHLDPYQTIPGRVKTALNSLTEGVVLIDDNEQIVLSNKAFENNFHRSASELLGTKLSLLSWRNQARVEGGESLLPWQKTLNDGDSVINVTLKCDQSEGDPVVIIVNSTPLKDGKENIRGALVSFNDVTELEKMNQELESMTGFLRHEMNNALIGATGSVALLQKREDLSESGKELVSRTQQLHRVIKHLLESVREARNIESTFKNKKSELVRLDLVVADVVKNYSGIYRDNDFILEAGDELTIRGQEERIIQMLDKLATNAIDHGKKGSPIVFSISQEKSNAVINVSNEGKPLPEDKQAIFDLFSSFRDETIKNENQGIGLYVVKLIAEAYGGSVEARDRKDISGVEFIIKFPVV